MIQLKTLCGGCKFWHRTDTEYARDRDGSYYCDDSKVDLSVGLCSLVKFDPSCREHEGWPDESPRVVDGSGFFAALWTKDVYGCIKGEPREAK